MVVSVGLLVLCENLDMLCSDAGRWLLLRLRSQASFHGGVHGKDDHWLEEDCPLVKKQHGRSRGATRCNSACMLRL